MLEVLSKNGTDNLPTWIIKTNTRDIAYLQNGYRGTPLLGEYWNKRDDYLFLYEFSHGINFDVMSFTGDSVNMKDVITIDFFKKNDTLFKQNQ